MPSRTNYFYIVLISLVLLLFAKTFSLFSTIKTQVVGALNVRANSELIGSAYANQKRAETLVKSDQNGKSDAAQKSAQQTKVVIAGQEMYGDSTPSEAQILKNLSQKKQIIENKQEEIETKQSALKSTEKRIDDKLVQLKKTQSDVEAYLKKYQQQENLKIKSLVKIYENMRPKDAAKIFDELDNGTLFELISNMREARVAPILANMNPVKAKEISMEFAKKESIE